MPRNKYSRVSVFFHILLFLIVASCVLTYWQAAEYALNGNWHPEYYTQQSFVSLIPTWQKILKDLLALLLLAFSLIWTPTTPSKNQHKNNALPIIYSLCLCALSLAIARGVTSDLGFIEILYALRPIFFAISLFIFGHRHLNSYYLIYVLEGVNVLASIQVFYAFIQRQSAVINNNAEWLSIGFVRSVGTFIGPNTLGFFLVLAVFINIYILNSKKWRYILAFIYTIGIFFSGSRTALLILFLLIVERFYNKLIQSSGSNRQRSLVKYIVILLSPLMIVAAIQQVSDLSGRGSTPSMSGGRLEIILGYIDSTDALSLLFGRHLGFGSEILLVLNRGNLLGVDSSDSLAIADSTWASLLYQFGIMGILLFVALLYQLWQSPEYFYFPTSTRLNASNPKLGLLIYTMGIASTSVLFESYAAISILVPLVFFLRQPDLTYNYIADNNYLEEQIFNERAD